VPITLEADSGAAGEPRQTAEAITRNRPAGLTGGPALCVPSMIDSLEVKVLYPA
jgi:hypothetical protein